MAGSVAPREPQGGPKYATRDAAAAPRVAMVGRHPIVDATLATTGYELQFQGDDGAVQLDDRQATRAVIASAIAEIGLDEIVGNLRAHINIPVALLSDPTVQVLAPDRVVIEISRPAFVTSQLIAGLQTLRARGFVLALDNFVYGAEREPLLDPVSIVKLDLKSLGMARTRSNFMCVRDRDLVVLAKRVETYAQFEELRSLGFHRFQGYFFTRPEAIEGQALPAHKIALLRLLAQLQSDDASPDDVAGTIAVDPVLSYKLLRLLNSVSFGLRTKVSSIRDAAMLIGLRHLRQWASLIALTAVDGKPAEIVQLALVRAAMCERLGRVVSAPNLDAFFTVGLLSVLDALLDRPIPIVLASLPLAADVAAAINDEPGLLGDALRCARAYESGRPESTLYSSVDRTAINRAYLEAVQWAQSVRATV